MVLTCYGALDPNIIVTILFVVEYKLPTYSMFSCIVLRGRMEKYCKKGKDCKRNGLLIN